MKIEGIVYLFFKHKYFIIDTIVSFKISTNNQKLYTINRDSVHIKLKFLFPSLSLSLLASYTYIRAIQILSFIVTIYLFEVREYSSDIS